MSSPKENNKRKADEKDDVKDDDLPLGQSSITSKKPKNDDKKEEKKAPSTEEAKIFDAAAWVHQSVAFLPTDKIQIMVDRIFRIAIRRWNYTINQVALSRLFQPRLFPAKKISNEWKDNKDNKWGHATFEEFRKSPKFAEILDVSPFCHSASTNLLISEVFDDVLLTKMMFSVSSWNEVLTRKLYQDFQSLPQPSNSANAHEQADYKRQQKFMEMASKDCDKRNRTLIFFTKLLDASAEESRLGQEYGSNTSLDIAHPDHVFGDSDTV